MWISQSFYPPIHREFKLLVAQVKYQSGTIIRVSWLDDLIIWCGFKDCITPIPDHKILREYRCRWASIFNSGNFKIVITTVFVDTRLSKTKHPQKRFQNFRQSYMLSTDRIEIHQSQPTSMTQRRSEGHTSGCEWWISIWSVENTQDWLKFWKRFLGCFRFQSPL